MSEIVIKVENISKRYRIGVREKADTFAGQVKNIIQYPLNNLRNISRLKKFDKEDDPSVFWALRDINFEVTKGEVLGIIGHNGAGKSTLLKILSRITEPTSGIIKLKGRVSALLEVGTGFHPELTGRDNVYMNGTILGMTKKEIDQKFDEIIAFAGVEKHIDTPVKFYSSGMKVRLGFSVAAHLEPEILIIDEVLAVGDLGFQQKCLGKMDDVSRSGRTVLFVSHNMSSVEGLCSRCILLNNGEINFVGNVNNAIEKYRKKTIGIAEGSLSERQDRKGNGDFLFTKISFNNNSLILPGKKLIIRVEYIAFKTLTNVQMAFTICRNFEERIMVLDSRSQGVHIKINEGKGELVVIMPKLSLIPDIYVINVWASEGNVVMDYVLNAAKLTISDSDYYGTGNSLNSNKHGIVLSEACEWKI